MFTRRVSMRSFPLGGVRVLHPAQYDLLDNHHGDRPPPQKKERYPGCLAHAVIDMFYSAVANQRHPIHILCFTASVPIEVNYFMYILTGGGCTRFTHSRSRMTIDPRIPTMPGRSMSSFHHPGPDIACTKREAPWVVR